MSKSVNHRKIKRRRSVGGREEEEFEYKITIEIPVHFKRTEKPKFDQLHFHFLGYWIVTQPSFYFQWNRIVSLCLHFREPKISFEFLKRYV